jgi:hypothetical protein
MRAAVMVVAGALIAGCGLASGCAANQPRSAAAPSPAPVAPTRTTATSGTARPDPPIYLWTVEPVSAGRLGPSWHPGCPVGPQGLRMLTVRYLGFDGRAHDGELVVAAALVPDLAAIFGQMYQARFPIRLMRTVDAYGASDDASVDADNTSAFNCRPITGGTEWSQHAYGRAIDINPRENPYVLHGVPMPPGSSADRSRAVRGLIPAAVVAMFTRRGWTWGGRWADPIDYQHFEKH